LYNVQGSLLQKHAPWFRELIAHNEVAPIPLPDIRALDFDRFLSVLYPEKVSERDAKTVDEWTSILALAARFGAADIILLATTELARVAAPLDKLVLGRTYPVPLGAACDLRAWLGGAYRAIVERAEDLTLEEAERLGMVEVVKIARARREAVLVSGGGYDSDRKDKMLRIVEEAVGVEEEMPAVGVEVQGDEEGSKVGSKKKKGGKCDPEECCCSKKGKKGKK
ncbi:hypothetical protein PLICRDRAFT_97815, partial [Plicaturopsis crispa FD-325 SS-3]